MRENDTLRINRKTLLILNKFACVSRKPIWRKKFVIFEKYEINRRLNRGLEEKVRERGVREGGRGKGRERGREGERGRGMGVGRGRGGMKGEGGGGRERREEGGERTLIASQK